MDENGGEGCEESPAAPSARVRQKWRIRALAWVGRTFVFVGRTLRRCAKDVAVISKKILRYSNQILKQLLKYPILGRSIWLWCLGIGLIGVGVQIEPWVKKQPQIVAIDYYLYQLFRSKSPYQPPTETTLVLVSDEDYWKDDRLSRRQPIRRDYLAILLDRVSKYEPKVTVLDFDLRAPFPPNSEDLPVYSGEVDQLVTAIVEAAGRTTLILPTTISKDEKSLQPVVYDRALQRVSEDSCRQGFIHRVRDVRKIPLRTTIDEKAVASLAFAAADAFNPGAFSELAYETDARFPYSRFLTRNASPQSPNPSLGFVEYTAGELLAGTVPEKYLKGRIVVIGGDWGASYYGDEDRVDSHVTPVGTLPGAFVLANYIETLRSGDAKHEPAHETQHLVALFAAGALLIATALVGHGVMVALLVSLILFFVDFGVMAFTKYYLGAFVPAFLLVGHAITERLLVPEAHVPTSWPAWWKPALGVVVVASLGAVSDALISLHSDSTMEFGESLGAGLGTMSGPSTTPRVPPAAARGDLWVLAVGIGNYGNGVAPLHHRESDAQRITRAFESQRNRHAFREVHLLPILANDHANRTTWLDTIQRDLANVTQSDTVVLYLTGHAVTWNDRFYLLPNSGMDNLLSAGISIDDLNAATGFLESRTKSVLMLLDTCYSGAVAVADRRWTPPESVLAGVVGRDRLFILSAASRNELATETLFVNALVDGLAGKADDKQPKEDGLISIGELAAFVTARVADDSKGKQNPASRIPRSSANDLVFDNPAVELVVDATPPTPETKPQHGKERVLAIDFPKKGDRVGSTIDVGGTVGSTEGQSLVVVVRPDPDSPNQRWWVQSRPSISKGRWRSSPVYIGHQATPSGLPFLICVVATFEQVKLGDTLNTLPTGTANCVDVQRTDSLALRKDVP